VPGAFCFQMSCSNGKPEDQSNLGTALLGSGAIGTVSASRLSFGVFQYYGETWVPRADSPYGEVAGYYFTMKLVDGMTAGEALAYTRYALPGDDHPPMAWTTKLEFNLYGDPTRSLEQCDTAADCDDGSPCTGTESCEDGACVHTGAVDCAHLDDACTVGSCDPDSGECVSVPRIDGAPCDDGLYCTTDDACFEGECSGVERECSEREGYDAWCDEDEESCVWEEQKKGGCQHRPGAPLGPWFLALLALGGLWLRGSRGEA